MSASHLQVKGGSFRTKLEYVRDTFGSDEEKKLVQLLKDLDICPILEANWYGFDLFDKVLCFIADEFLDGDLSRLEEIGRYSAHRALTGVYQSFKQADFTDFLQRRMPTLHSRFYNGGRLEVPQITERGCRIHIISSTLRESDLYVASGFYQGAAEIMGHRQVSCKFEIRADRAQFLLLWST